MNQTYRIDGTRIKKRIEALADIGKTPDNGVSRMALTKEDEHAQQLVSQWMREAGLQVRLDHFGNLIGRKEGENPQAPVVMVGSHIDSVPNGGNFDGTIGVIGAIEVAQAIHDTQMEISYPLEIVAFCDEEGARFQGGLFGSRGMVGQVTLEELNKKDAQGISRYQALQFFGLNPDLMHQSVRGGEEVKVFLEMHIEQGPYLQSIDKPVGIVTGIAGPAWFGVKIIGEAGHAGTVPMNLRRDPMVGVAEIIQAIERICGDDPTAATVGTVGKITAHPGGSNVIPDSVEFTVDIRDIDEERRDQALSTVKGTIESVCQKRGLSYELEEHLLIKPTDCAQHVIEAMKKASQHLGLGAPTLVSGAGHDAMAMSEITDIGLIFVRCLDGISHNPKEWTEADDITKGVELLLETVLQYVEHN
jgi:allantoate deiminase